MRWFNCAQSESKKRPRRIRSMLQTYKLDELEPRTLLAGNVTAVLDANGIIQITGDSAGNCVSAYSTIYKIEIGGCKYDAASDMVTPPGDTKINGVMGGGATFPQNAVKGLTAKLGGGNDFFGSTNRGSALSVNGPVSISMTCWGICLADNDRVDIGDYSKIKGDLTIATGEADDTVYFQTSITVDGTTQISTGSGNDKVLDWDGGTHFLDGLLIDTGIGNDIVSLHFTEVGGTTQIKTGDGDDRVGIHDAVFDQGFEVLLGKAGSGLYPLDVLQVENSDFLGSFKADGQEGYDIFDELNNTYVGSGLTIHFESFQNWSSTI
jgi:hypothetical protein